MISFCFVKEMQCVFRTIRGVVTQKTSFGCYFCDLKVYKGEIQCNVFRKHLSKKQNTY